MPSRILPKALKAGDTIRIVSPASPVKPEKLEVGLAHWRSQGFEIEIGENALNTGDYLAGSDVERAKDLMDAFTADHVSAVLCARGGYGCARLLPYLDLDVMAHSAKLFMGFSDITTLHAPLNTRGLVTFHSPMPLTLSAPREEWVYKSLYAAMAGQNPIPADAPKGKTLVSGVAEGDLLGGCLCLLTDMIGTEIMPDYRGQILLIEDVDESPHRVDAMLTHYLHSGALEGLGGIVFGEVTRCRERDTEGIGDKDWRSIVSDRLSGLGIPIIIDFPFGHAANMLTLPLGTKVRMNADEGTVEYLEPICS